MMSRRSRPKETPAKPPQADEPFYQPISYNWQNRQCKKFRLPFVRVIELRMPANPQFLRNRIPSRVRETDGDGNCLFRCFSLVITGSDVHHSLVRKLVVEHIAQNGKIFSAFFPESLQNDPGKYLSNTKMAREGTWGSDVEIMAAAHLFKTRIYVYTIHGDNWQWVEHNLDLTSPNTKMFNESIYLMHTDLCHYDLVEDVELKHVTNGKKETTLKSEYDMRSKERYGEKAKQQECARRCNGRRMKSKLTQPPSQNSPSSTAFSLAADEFEYARWLHNRNKAVNPRRGRRRFLSSEN